MFQNPVQHKTVYGFNEYFHQSTAYPDDHEDDAPTATNTRSNHHPIFNPEFSAIADDLDRADHGYLEDGVKCRPLTLEEVRKIAKAEKRKKRRATLKYRTLHASRERIRVESFNKAFTELRELLPTTPVDKKLSKIEILRVSIAYIKYLQELLLLG